MKMNIDKSSAFQSDVPREVSSSLAKITDTQKVIRKKFVKAYANRIDHEKDVNQTMKPLTGTHTAINKNRKKKLLKVNNINELCNELQMFINSQISGNTNYSQEIKMIISKLRELNIIV